MIYVGGFFRFLLEKETLMVWMLLTLASAPQARFSDD